MTPQEERDFKVKLGYAKEKMVELAGDVFALIGGGPAPAGWRTDSNMDVGLDYIIGELEVRVLPSLKEARALVTAKKSGGGQETPSDERPD
jgi:hypothetical protein